MDRLEALLIHMGIDLCGGNVGVPEEFLDDPQVCAVLKQVSGKRVAEQVRVDVLS